MNTFLREARLVFALFLAAAALSASAANTATVTPSVTTYSTAGGNLSFTVALGYTTAIAGLDFTVTTPTGWQYLSSTGPDVPPRRGDLGAFGLDFAYISFPSNLATFSFTLSYPVGMTGSKAITAIQASFTDETTGAVSVVTIPDITIAPPPALSAIQSIASQTLTAGSPASSFVPVTAQDGYSPYSYAITPALPSALALNSTTGAITGTPTAAAATANYTITVTDAVGATANASFTLGVHTAPTITTQPTTQTIVAGSPVTFSVVATGAPAPSYQWKKGGVNIAGATGSSFTIEATAATNAGSYTVFVANLVGSVTSSTATLTVNVPPSITTQPLSIAVTAGQGASFTVVASGNPTPTIQWERQAANTVGFVALTNTGTYSGVATSTLTVTNATLAMSADQFRATVSNGVGAAVSSAVPAVLTVYTIPAITTQPTTQTIVAGSPVTFSVVATGAPAPNYQWKKGGVNIAGATGSSFTIEATAATNAGSYTVFVANLVGSVTSSTATLTVNVPPSITTQPQSIAVTAGQGASFTVVASGNPTPTIQWERQAANTVGFVALTNTATYSGVATSTLTVTNATLAMSADQFRATVSNGVGAAVSSAVPAVLTVYTIPAITSQPSTQTIVAGSPVTLTVVATGSPAPTYQWKKGGVNIAGATGSSYTIEASAATNAGSYTVFVANLVGSVTSSTATLTVNVPPSITTQPQSIAVTAGQGASFTVVASGNPTPTIQWERQAANTVGFVALTNTATYSGVATSTLSVTNAALAMSADQFRATVSNGVGAAVSSAVPAVLTVYTIPTITTQPTTQTIVAGSPVTLTVVATGSPAPTYQWKKGGVNIAGATGSSYTIEATATTDTGSYTVFVANIGGSVTSSAATLTVNVPPGITTQPQSAAVTVGQGATFTVVATGIPTPTYQWKKDGLVISGAISATLSLTALQPADSGSYVVVVTNAVSSVSSVAATLTVTATPIVNATAFGRYVLSRGQSMTLQLDPAITGATIQWRRNGMDISGATSREATASSPGYYQARYTVGTQTVTSAPIFVVEALQRSQILGWGFTGYGALNVPTTASGASSITADQYSSLALKADGSVVSWGSGATSVPAGLSSAVAVSASSAHSVALKADGSVVAWGNNNSGQTVIPAGLSGVVAVAAGYQHSLAVRSDGTVIAWGSAASGAIQPPADLGNVATVAAGNQFSVALRSDGTVVAWGRNDSGQTTVPAGLAGVTAIAAGDNHVLAQKSDGTVVAWGNNGSGQTALPTGLSSVVAIAAGQYHCLALKSDGSVVAWGSNNNGETAVPVGLNLVRGIAGGHYHSLVLRESAQDISPVITTPTTQTAYVGQNVTLSVGVNVGTEYATTYQWRKGGANITGATNATLGLPRIAATDAGSYDVVVTNWLGSATSAAAVVTVNATAAVSMNVSGQRVIAPGGNLNLTATTVLPGPVTYQWRKNGQPIAGASSASYTVANAAVRSSGVYQVVVTNTAGPLFGPAVFVSVSVPTQVRAWGLNTSGQTTVPVGLTNAISVAAGSDHTLALKSDGTVVAWGGNLSGQATIPSGLNGVAAVAASGNYSMALKADGTVVTWGGSINYTPIGLSNVIAIAAGNSAMALRSDGTVVVWDGSSVRTDTPAGLDGVSSIAAGIGGHYLAAKTDGSVVSWGYNDYGQTTVPAGLTSVVAVAAGQLHSLALKSDGTVVAWGYNGNGQTTVPVGLSGVVAIAASARTSFALRNDDTVVAWGSDDNGVRSLPAGLSNSFFISAGSYHALALRDSSGDGAPSITTPPASQLASISQTVSFTVAATGTPTPSFQWRFNGSAISGATGATYTLTNAQSYQAGSYDAVVSNYLGTATSSAATLLVGSAPSIGSQPSSQSVGSGGTVQLAVSVNGTAPFSYQWRFNGSTISGATAATYTVGNAQTYQSGSYDVVVSNYLGNATSSAATLLVGSAPSIGSQPASQSVGTGGTVQLAVWVDGTAPFSYQWRKNSVAVSGATAATLRLTSFQPADAGGYDVVVTNALGTAISSVATLTSVAATPPTINSQPVGGSIFAGNLAAFSVSFSAGYSSYFLQWRKDGIPIPGATSPSYIRGNSQPSFSGVYDVVVATQGGSVTSSPVTLLVVPNPGFVIHPLAQPIGAGGTVVLTARAIGDLPLTYQWRKDGTPLTGATDTSLRVADFLGAAVYDVVVTNPAGSATSSAAVLTLAAGVADLPVITSVPTGAILNLNNQGSFRVTATSSIPLFYQWRKDGAAIAGATGSVYVLGAVTPASAGSFDVVVSNSSGSVLSPPAVLTVNPPVIFNSQPVSASTFVGLGVTFSASATGFPGTPTYQWRKDTVAITGATSSSFTVAAAQLADVGSYDVIATASAWSATSNAATLSVTNSAPQITAQPAGATLAVGGNATPSVAATGSAPLTYQWRREGVSILGATLASLSIANAQTYQAGVYDVVVTNSVGSATSVGARLNVIPRVVAYSARLLIDNDGAVAVFTIEGTLPKKVLLRAIGPGLAPFGFSGLPDPQLELFSSTGALLAINNDWASSADAAAITTTTSAVGAFALTIGSRDSAVLATLAPGTYTARAKPASGVGGTGYLELYDADLATGPMSTLPYVAVRGRMGAGGGVVIGGLGSNGRGQRSYLVRAIGPALGLPGAHANPAMLVVRDGTLVGSNDDWDATATEAAATTAATARVATFSLPAGGRDAALVLTGNLHASACTVQVGGSDALGGTVLLELHDLDAVRPVTFAPAIASAPVSTTVAIGEATTLRVLAQGTAPLTYQWRKDGIPLDGATTATLSLAAVQASQGGSYTVFVSNALGAATSLSAVLTVQSGGSGSAATQAVVGSGYTAGATATITNTLTYTAAATGLGWKVTLPLGWSFVSAAGMLGDVRPVVGTVGALEWAWSVPPVGPVTFTYTVNVPAGTAGDQFLAASGIVRFNGALSQPIATPSPLLVPQITMHSADTNADFRISLVELTRVIELYNTRLGTTRTGRYLIQDGSEDGYGLDRVTPAGAPVTITRFHSADSNRNADISLFELTRVIELYNVRSGSVRTGAYRLLAGSEDGFAPGPEVIAYTNP